MDPSVIKIRPSLNLRHAMLNPWVWMKSVCKCIEVLLWKGIRVVGEKNTDHIRALVQNFFAESIAIDQMNLRRRGSWVQAVLNTILKNYNSPGFVMEHWKYFRCSTRANVSNIPGRTWLPLLNTLSLQRFDPLDLSNSILRIYSKHLKVLKQPWTECNALGTFSDDTP